MDSGIDKVAEAFSSHRFAETFPYLAATICWENVGGDRFSGREAVIEQCRQWAQYFENVATTFVKLDVTQTASCVVVESVAHYKEENGELSTVASCDVYRFLDGMINEVTSYNIELK